MRYKIHTLNVALLHEQLEVAHDLILELLEPFMEFHMVLVCPCIVVLTATSLAPLCLCQLERVVDLGVEYTVPLRRLAV